MQYTKTHSSVFDLVTLPWGLVSLRHSHGYRFGQDDMYVLVKLKAAYHEIHVREKG